MNEGTYYVKELKAPKGYALVDEVKTVTVKSGQEATVTFSDPPQMNPVELLLKKKGMEQEYVDPSGTAAYQGAQFLVKFYAELLEKASQNLGLSNRCKSSLPLSGEV